MLTDSFALAIKNAIPRPINRPGLRRAPRRSTRAVEARFFAAPGAKSLHHAYIGGLAEHTCEVVELCLCVAQVFPQLDRDLLLAAAILDAFSDTDLAGACWIGRADRSAPRLTRLKP